MRNQLVAATVFCGITCCLGLTTAAQEATRSSWDCLPANTAVAVRIPNGKAIFDEFKATKLGSLLFDEDRVDKIQRMVSERDEWKESVDELEEFGLIPEDILQCILHETGFAAVLDEAGGQPFWVGLGWLEPGDGLAGRIEEAISMMIEKQDDEEHPIRRSDSVVDDHDVMLLTIPEVTYDYDDDAFDLPENFDELDEEEQARVIREVDEQATERAETKTTYTQLLLANRDGRLLAAVTLDSSDEAQPAERVECLTAVFAKFMAAHHREAGTFTSQIAATQGVRDALPQNGEVLCEIYADVRPFLSLAKKTRDAPFDVEEFIRSLGADRLGVMALRLNLHESLMQFGAFVQVLAPRTGLMRVLDQPAIEPDPPAWVPASVLEYGHLSLDLGDLYNEIKAVSISTAGEKAEMGFQRMEASVKAMAGTDVASVLSSLGHRHTLLNFGPRIRQLEITDGEDLPMLSERVAMVWQVEDEELWNRLLQASRGFAAMAGDALEFGKAQGFEGYRINSDTAEGGLFLGKGYLVLAIGQDVIDETLALINNPPAGNDAFRNSETYRRAIDIMRLEPGQTVEYADNSRNARVLLQFIEQLLERPRFLDELTVSVEGEEDPQAAEELAELIRSLMPKEEELENILGVAVGYIRMTEHGVEIKSVNELPR